MAIFTINSGQTLRMDKMIGQGSAGSAALLVLPDGTTNWVWRNTNTNTVLYEAISTGPVVDLPFSTTGGNPNAFSLGDVTLDMEFFDPQFGPGAVGTLTGAIWQDVTLLEYITYVGGPEGPVPVDWYFELSFAGPVLFGGDDTVTLGGGDDYFMDPGGNLTASLGDGNDIAYLYEALQGVTDVKFVDAGAGNDQIHYQSGNGTILGGAGNDAIGSAGNSDGTWVFEGGSGRDTILAYMDSRIVDGEGSGNDLYNGNWNGSAGGPDVTLSYATGRRGIVVDLPGNVISGGGHGTDQIYGILNIEGTAGRDVMTGLVANNGFGGVAGVRFWGLQGSDVLDGAEWHDMLDGGAGNDVMNGHVGNDTLYGGSGNDTLTGGAGRDVMNGGNGADRFVFLDLSDSTVAAAGRDLINGFSAVHDEIDLSAIDANGNIGPNDAFVFVGTAAFTAAGQVRYEQVGLNTIVTVNTVGNLGAELRIDLAGLHVLTADTFVL